MTKKIRNRILNNRFQTTPQLATYRGSAKNKQDEALAAKKEELKSEQIQGANEGKIKATLAKYN